MTKRENQLLRAVEEANFRHSRKVEVGKAASVSRVKCKNSQGWHYSMRFQLADTEYELFQVSTLEIADKWLSELTASLDKEGGPAGMLLAPVIKPTAMRIAATTDTPERDNGAYATKNHMRAWARDIVNYSDVCLALLGIHTPVGEEDTENA
jgi:hypothetical protein